VADFVGQVTYLVSILYEPKGYAVQTKWTTGSLSDLISAAGFSIPLESKG
jgi:hypothetical protein